MRKKLSKNTRQILRLLGKAAGLVLVVYLMFGFVFGVTILSGESMFPKMRDGDFAIFYRLEKEAAADEAVLFNRNEHILAGRVVAQAGDVVDLSEDGSVLINGNPRREEIVAITESLDGGISFPYTVPENSYFILCDNREHSADSRFYGAVPFEDIAGKPMILIRLRNF